jgi:hypothetical protein
MMVIPENLLMLADCSVFQASVDAVAEYHVRGFVLFLFFLTALAFINTLPSAVSSPYNRGTTNRTFTFCLTSDWVNPKQAVPSPPEICGGNSHPNINTFINSGNLVNFSNCKTLCPNAYPIRWMRQESG